MRLKPQASVYCSYSGSFAENAGEAMYTYALFYWVFISQAYVDKFKFCSVMAEDALEFFLEYFPDLKKKGVHKIEGKKRCKCVKVAVSLWLQTELTLPVVSFLGLEFDSWLNVAGWPPYLPDLSAGQSLMKPAEHLAELWGAENLDIASINKTNIKSWKNYQTVYFLEKILAKPPLPTGRT